MTSVRMLMVAAMAVVLTTGAAAWAGGPTDQLRGRVDRVLRVLEDPQMKPEDRAVERRAAVRALVAEIFDVRELSQRALADVVEVFALTRILADQHRRQGEHLRQGNLGAAPLR